MRWILPAALLLAVAPLTAQTSDRARIVRAVDSLVADALKGGRAAGISVAVVRGRDTIVMKPYGYADLEFDVPTPPGAIYEIGSVTKQFTAAAILQLQEQGKLSLDDEITKHLPNYATQGRRITLRRLLDHTSGIKGYTEMPEFGALMPQKLPRDTLVTLFSARPFDFEPGEAQVYNNSAFFLLGLVVEKVSGMKYEDYVKQKLFEPAGMKDSRYCSERALIKKRAHGYDASPTGLQRAAYLDHTWPYAAGSLCSTVGDLVAWNQTLHGTNTLLGPAAYRELITPGALNDGTRLRYAKGIGVDSTLGQRVILHGGGINGFLSSLTYFPDDTLSIVVLINTTGPVSPDAMAANIARVIYGAWSPTAVPLAGDLQPYIGEFRGVGRGQEMMFTVAQAPNGGLTVKTRTGQPQPIVHLGGDLFALGGMRIRFMRENGVITRLSVSTGAGYSVLTRR